MVAPMEAMGIHMLINENMVLTRDADRIRVIGTATFTITTPI